MAPMMLAKRSPAGAERSHVIAAATAATTRRFMTPTTSRITKRMLNGKSQIGNGKWEKLSNLPSPICHFRSGRGFSAAC
jgi:hypothetical protein